MAVSYTHLDVYKRQGGGLAALVKTLCGAGVGGAVYVACLLLSGELRPELEMLRQARQNREKEK